MNKDTWPTTEAEIVNCSLSWLRSDYGEASEGRVASSTYKAEYVYEVDGVIYRHSMTISDPDRVGEQFLIAYDPVNPHRNDAPDQTLNVKDSKSLLRHTLIWGSGILLVILLKHFVPDLD